MRRLPVVVLTTLLLCACQHHPNSDKATAPSSQALFSPGIVAPDLARHLRALTERNSQGDNKQVVDYVVAQFQRMGLEPGNHGSWLQDVPYLEATVRAPQNTLLTIEGVQGTTRLAYGTDMLASSPANLTHAVLKQSPLVFVGYGVNAPDEQWNDYAGIDVRGKTVIVLSNDPGWSGQDPTLFKGRSFTHYGLWVYKLEEAARQGAAAAFIVYDEAATGSSWSSVQNAWKRPQRSLPQRDGEARVPIAGWLDTAAAKTLFTQAGLDFAALRQQASLRGFKPVSMKLQASMVVDSDVVQKHTSNIVAKLTGTRQPNEAIIYSAHWDKISNDSNPLRRAIDSSSGMAGLLEIAEAVVHSAPKPHRSVLFLATAMGDWGMLGSHYYIDHPLVPLQQTVAAINLDTLPIAGPDHTIALIGYGQSQLDDYLEAAAKMHHRSVTPDQAPERGFFFRSDQINFANAGIPVLYASSSSQRVDHTSEQGFDMRGAIEDLRMLYTIGDKLSLENSYPQWKPDSDFKRPATISGH